VIDFEGPPPGRQASTAGASVLVVDDEPGVRHFTARILRDEGYGVHEAADGLEALELVRAAAPIDAVVSDIVMPRLNGVELLQSLSTLRPDLPVILMSGYGAIQLAERGIASPCSVLSKPFPPELLVAEVRRCIRTLLT
jgi:CheY-like chemotaxis protein